MRTECRIELGVSLEHVADVSRVADFSCDLVQQSRQLHLAIILLVLLMRVAARLARLRHIDGPSDGCSNRRLRFVQRLREQRVARRIQAYVGRLGLCDKNAGVLCCRMLRKDEGDDEGEELHGPYLASGYRRAL